MRPYSTRPPFYARWKAYPRWTIPIHDNAYNRLPFVEKERMHLATYSDTSPMKLFRLKNAIPDGIYRRGLFHFP